MTKFQLYLLKAFLLVASSTLVFLFTIGISYGLRLGLSIVVAVMVVLMVDSILTPKEEGE